MRRYKKEDAESIFQVVRQREIAETTIMIPHPYPRQSVDWWINFVNENFDKGKAYEFGLFKKDTPNDYVGNCGFVSISKEHNHGELGFFIRHEYFMEKSGFIVEGLARHEVLKRGTYEDVWHLGMIRSEWLNRR